jgi:hypothetical protein
MAKTARRKAAKREPIDLMRECRSGYELLKRYLCRS